MKAILKPSILLLPRRENNPARGGLPVVRERPDVSRPYENNSTDTASYKLERSNDHDLFAESNSRTGCEDFMRSQITRSVPPSRYR